MLMSHAAIERAAGIINADDFSHLPYSALFRVMVQLRADGVAVDLTTVAEPWRKVVTLKPGESQSLINTLAEAVPTAAHVEDYAQQVLQASNRRRLIKIGASIGQIAHDAEDGEAALEQAENLLATLRLRARRHRRIDEGVTAAELVKLTFPPIKWIVPDLFAEGLCILAGKSKQGKSWLAYQIAIAVAGGGVALGHIPVDEGRVLYLALEDTKRRLQSRLLRLIGTASAPERLHLFNRWPRMQEGGARDLCAWFRKHPDTRLVVIDTFAKIRSTPDRPGNAYDEDYKALGEVKALADDHGACVLVIHHFNKLKLLDDWVDSISGSIGLSGAADGIIGFFRVRSEEGALLKVTGRDIEDERDWPLERVAESTEQGGFWVAVPGSAEQYVKSQERRVILDALRNASRPLKTKEVSDITGKPHSTVRGLLVRMSADGEIRSDDGFYSPITPQPAECGVDIQSAFTSTASTPQTGSTPSTPQQKARVFQIHALSVDPVDPVDPVDFFAQNRGFELSSELTLPETCPDPEPRRRCFNLANALGFPHHTFADGRSLKGGEKPWRQFCATVTLPWVEAALAEMGAT